VVLDAAIRPQFTEISTLALMARSALDRACEPSSCEDLFEQQPDRERLRELLLSAIVEQTTFIAWGSRASPHTGSRLREPVRGSLPLLFARLEGTDPSRLAALVRSTFESLAPVAAELHWPRAGSAGGLRVRVVDGGRLSPKPERLESSPGLARGFALGRSLVVYEPDLDMASDWLVCDEAPAGACGSELLARVQPGELWLVEGSLHDAELPFGIAERGAKFLIREPGDAACAAEGRLERSGRIDGGTVHSQKLECSEPSGNSRRMRRLLIRLDQPAADGATTIRLLTNASVRQLSACSAAQLYRQRRRSEAVFQRLEAAVHAEVPSHCDARAVPLACALAVIAYDVLAVIQRAIHSAHPPEQTGIEWSAQSMAEELRVHYPEMMRTGPSSNWLSTNLSAQQLALRLVQLASRVDPRRW
jgi:hypothetical protein